MFELPEEIDAMNCGCLFDLRKGVERATDWVDQMSRVSAADVGRWYGIVHVGFAFAGVLMKCRWRASGDEAGNAKVTDPRHRSAWRTWV
jgi:hypothetical protein